MSHESNSSENAGRREQTGGRERKRRRIAGEDDTDRDIRFAREDRASALERGNGQGKRQVEADAPLMDLKGHINLFPGRPEDKRASKNVEAEKEKAKKKKEAEDQYTMRFSNAAGYGQAIHDSPWYGHSRKELADGRNETPSKNTWGNEDPLRKERERTRLAADDPLAKMRKGASAVRRADKQKEEWQIEKRRDIEDLARQQSRRSRKNEWTEEHGLEGFDLDDVRGSGDARRHHKQVKDAKRHHGSQHHHHRHGQSHRSHHRHGNSSLQSQPRKLSRSHVRLGSDPPLAKSQP